MSALAYTITFYDNFDRMSARAEVKEKSTLKAIEYAADICNVDTRRIGKIEIQRRLWYDEHQD